MLKNNEESEWSDFVKDPLEIPTSTLSRYLNMIKSQGLIISSNKGHYQITPDVKRRFNELSKITTETRKINFPPKIILKKGRNYDHWILWMVYNNNYCKWSDFLDEPVAINQTSLSKYLKLLIREGLIGKDDEKKEYKITRKGKVEYAYMLQNYDLDRQSILERESKRIEEITNKTVDFFKKYNVVDEYLRFRFLNNIVKLDYSRVESLLKKEDDFNKILLFLSINHPNEFPNYESPETFSKKYEIKNNTLTYYIDQIVENEIYPIKFFQLKVSAEQVYYFQENEKIETMLRAITEEHITMLTYLNRLFSKSLSKKSVIEKILEEACKNLFNNGLKESLKDFLSDYINYLAYKIETEQGFRGVEDKLEGIIWQNMAEIFQEYKSQNEQELIDIEEKIRVNPQEIENYYLKIKILIYLGRYNEASRNLDELIDRFPKNKLDIRMKKASILKKINEIDAGFEIIEDLLQHYPDNKDLLLYKTYWLQYMDQKVESLEIIENLIKNFPNNHTYRDTYGEILMYNQKYQEALDKFQKSIELSHNEWYINQTYIKLGICYKQLGNNEKSIKFITKGKELTKTETSEPEVKKKWLSIADTFLAMIKESY
jgi:predicted transcriptional regulator